MLNEHERENGPEEGEYHFSDEGGYESHVEEEEAKAPTVTESGDLASKFSSYRRLVIIGGIFAGIFLLAYLIVPPLTTSTSTDITAASSPTAPTSVVKAAASISPAAPVVVAKGGPVENPRENKGLADLISTEKAKLTADKNQALAPLTSEPPPATPPSLTAAAIQPVLPEKQPEQANSRPSPSSSADANLSSFANLPNSTASTAAQEFIASPTGTLLGSSQASQSAENKAVLERLTAIEETNTKLIGQLHAEYTQKLAVYEAQNSVLQEQVRSLNAQLIKMEAEMNKLVQAMNKQTSPSANDRLTGLSDNDNNNVSLPSSAAAAPLIVTGQTNYKSNYTVQAIIPGRAWLRTEAGETITVAEGDLLKSLGRVTKIDPYDGTIQVDTGNKVVTLTYGNGDYA